MKPTRMLLASSLAIALVSCANQKDKYDTTANPYGTADAGQPQVANNNPNLPAQPVNPTYDTPAAYEESSSAPVNPDALPPAVPTRPGAGSAAHGATATHGGTVHTVVAGDNLTRISNKYKVSIASIKKANNMTNDTVVIGKKLVIPAR